MVGRKELTKTKHKLVVKVSKTPEPNGVVAVKKSKVRNRLLNKLFGSTNKTILVLGDSVVGVSIYENEEGGKTNG